MTDRRNVLWIMCDQLRFDYLGCAGHPSLKTPNIDRLAARGVRFTNAYVQSPICGPSRMSFYTGRYVHSHGATWNAIPLPAGEPTLGDHLRAEGVRSVLVGKTHMKADLDGMMRLGIDPETEIGVRIAECGFEPYERDDGLHPDGPYDPDPRYDDYLREHGFDGENPWEQWANSAEDEDGRILSGWLLSHADKPARVDEPHSETAYMTDRAMDFIREAKADARPWCLHLSYIKPHWPYIVPAPYHDMYGPDDVLPPVRSEEERRDPHPVYASYMTERFSRAFSRDEVRERVIPAYMGLISQIDDHLGRLMDFLEAEGLLETTLIVFTSDHGDYLGDHWLGEKELFHTPSVKIPLIIADPDPKADATRGSVSDALVEAIDLAPTFLEYFAGKTKPNVLEGASLMPHLRGDTVSEWRGYVISECDYAMRRARTDLERPVARSRMFMICDGRWKYVYAEGLRPMLFDLESDPQEFTDLGADPAHEDERARLKDALFAWSRRVHNRITITDEQIAAKAGGELRGGILIGYWDEDEVEEARRDQKPGAPL
ncbi:alkaline phosphatase family protein [Amorphus orientalis]|uniref:Arylsulfatase A-like enzyme n=1 Tax=Amorphus orientalis TaxID=649198 RepID=A0AAE3VLB7_9HYPH|nr:alkaline phosphatase family protein [Amorphus orientalis]MDQ0314269.1 arylsulfatase A-like enzyme [Amorphus orientalis]